MPEDARSTKTTSGTAHRRLRVVIRGAVQGVGFRPFVYRLAAELNLTGWVLNSSQGVFIEVEGARQPLESFLFRLDRERPPRSFIHSLEYSFLDPVGYARFEIRTSDDRGDKTTLILPDIATCSDCLREIFDPADRRYRYPFTNCTNCGPRFSIIEALPYDRSHTTMKRFVMCAQCRAEYENPRDRRFHAQPNACPHCGPHLELWDGTGRVLATHHEALLAAAEAIRRGLIVAVKGLGGFHLIVDARCDRAVRRLRTRKRREEKPFALMYPSLELVKAHCEVSELEERLLTSPESPIVLLRRKSTRPPDPASKISPAVAPHNPTLGIMLPYTPLHHLLLAELGFPVVATSGNLSDEPICIDERDALVRLGDIADLFLVHNRPIARHVDDSVVRIVLGRELVLRRARGYAPLPLPLKRSSPPLLAVGAHLKNTVALTVDHQVFISQHIGDLETAEAFTAFQRVISDLQRLYDVRPTVIARDAHPEYLSTKYARNHGAPSIDVQHHVAHVVSCMAENELEGPVLGVAWDGTGYGPDGTIWGGEFLRVEGDAWVRVASFRTFGLPGGERAIKEPRRSALGLLYEIFGAALFQMTDLEPVRAFTGRELAVLQTMLQKHLNVPRTSSVGRLFDAVAAIAGRRQRIRFEGQAAMELEFSLNGIRTDATYPFRIVEPVPSPVRLAAGASSPIYIIDWEPMMREIVDDVRRGVALGEISVRFHNTLIEAIVAIAERAGEERLVLTGGCFQNTYLTERAVHRLRAEGFRPYWHQRIPPNDGGIALGQAVIAGWRWKEDVDDHVPRRSWKDCEYQWR